MIHFMYFIVPVVIVLAVAFLGIAALSLVRAARKLDERARTSKGYSYGYRSLPWEQPKKKRRRKSGRSHIAAGHVVIG